MLAPVLARCEALIAFPQFMHLKVGPAMTSCLMGCCECLLLIAESGQCYWKKKARGLIEGSLKSCKFGSCKVILGNYLLKSLCTFSCKNCRAEPLKCISNESALNVVRRILQLAPAEARDVVQSERISALGV